MCFPLPCRRVVSELVALSQMAIKFPDFDLEGKKVYLDKVQILMCHCYYCL